MMHKIACYFAIVLEVAGYAFIAFCVYVLAVYFTAQFQCILHAPEPGFELECALEKTSESLSRFSGNGE